MFKLTQANAGEGAGKTSAAVVLQHPHPARLNIRECKSSPDLVVSGHTTARNGDPTRSIPVLHIEALQTVKREGHSLRRLGRILPVVLLIKDINLAYRLAAIEIYLEPVRKGVSRRRIIPIAVDPAACAIALIDAPSRPDASNTRRAASTMSRRR